MNFISLFVVVVVVPRLKLQPHMSDVLKTLHAPKEWMLACRPCSPRVLFIFDSCTLNRSDLQSDQVVTTKIQVSLPR